MIDIFYRTRKDEFTFPRVKVTALPDVERAQDLIETLTACLPVEGDDPAAAGRPSRRRLDGGAACRTARPGAGQGTGGESSSAGGDAAAHRFKQGVRQMPYGGSMQVSPKLRKGRRMNLIDFIKLCGVKVQPYQRPVLEALERGETIRTLTWNEQRAAQRAMMREALEDFRRRFRKPQ